MAQATLPSRVTLAPNLLSYTFTTKVRHNALHPPRQLIRLTPRRRLRIHPHHILRPTRPRKRPPLTILAHLPINLFLNAPRGLQLPLRIRRAKRSPIQHLNLELPVRKIFVRVLPFLETPGFVCENGFDEEEVG